MYSTLVVANSLTLGHWSPAESADALVAAAKEGERVGIVIEDPVPLLRCLFAAGVESVCVQVLDEWPAFVFEANEFASTSDWSLVIYPKASARGLAASRGAD